MTGAEDRGEYLLSFGAGFSAVATPDFAGDHSRPDGLLRPPVGGIQVGIVQEGEQMRPLLAQVFNHADICRIGIVAQEEAIRTGLDLADSHESAMWRNIVAPLAIPQGQGIMEYFKDVVWQTCGHSCVKLEHLLATVRQVTHAALVDSQLELSIWRPAVTDEAAFKSCPQHTFCLEIAPASGNGINSHGLTDKDPQPVQLSSHLPSGLISGDSGALTDGNDQALVGDIRLICRTGNGLTQTSTAHREFKADLQYGHHLFIGETEGLVHLYPQGHRPGAHLRGSSADGIGGLSRMSWLNASTAPAAFADMNPKLCNIRARLRDISLVLGGYVHLIYRSTTVGAAIRQWDIHPLVNVLRDRAVSPCSVVDTRTSARLSGVGLRLSPGEWGCLAFAGPMGCLQFTTQPFNLLFQPVLLPFEAIDLLFEALGFFFHVAVFFFQMAVFLFYLRFLTAQILIFFSKPAQRILQWVLTMMIMAHSLSPDSVEQTGGVA